LIYLGGLLYKSARGSWKYDYWSDMVGWSLSW